MTDYQLRARIPQELADKLFQVIKELQEQTNVADVTTSSITRAALEQYIKGFERKSKRDTIIIEIPNTLTNAELKNLTDTMELVSEQISGETELKKAYRKIEISAMRESTERISDNCQDNLDSLKTWVESKTEEELQKTLKNNPELSEKLKKMLKE